MTAETATARYVFLDVIGFTQGRSVEAQADIVGALNRIVQAALSEHKFVPEQLILLPTGDGICIAILDPASFDAHLTTALAIAGKIAARNGETGDVKRRFTVRIGINQNVDNLITDINGRRNIAGAGINAAQRIMSLADGNQVLAGQSVYDILQARELYMGRFRPHPGRDKHGNTFPVYQYAGESPGLDTCVPAAFQSAKKSAPRLTELIAFYLAHAIRLESFLLPNEDLGGQSYAVTVFLYYLAGDSVKRFHATRFETPLFEAHAASTPQEQLAYYRRQDSIVIIDFAQSLRERHLRPYADCFIQGSGGPIWIAVSDIGKRRLAEEYPSVAELLEKGAPF